MWKCVTPCLCNFAACARKFGADASDADTLTPGKARLACFSFCAGERGFFFGSCECETTICAEPPTFLAISCTLLTSFSWPTVIGFIRPKAITACFSFCSSRKSLNFISLPPLQRYIDMLFISLISSK